MINPFTQSLSKLLLVPELLLWKTNQHHLSEQNRLLNSTVNIIVKLWKFLQTKWTKWFFQYNNYCTSEIPASKSGDMSSK